ncbi:polyadenylate-binding protein 2-B-like [Haliotis rubra]|uniref:polyadenylate-binding protein 2-B-like n=1 Tax=Haliotis rubra TaxID=36100 RepID=UPI001EE57E01|nr:polyadenylate-binding protein 2-B-like [Haliotis rubra]
MADIENGDQEESFTETNGDFDTSQFDPEATDADTSAIVSEDVGVEDPELEAIKARVKEMEEEAEKLKEMQKEVDSQMNMSSSSISSFPSVDEKIEADARSIYCGNVDYGATAEELEQHFHGCGSVNRVTILCDKFTGHPKGFAYIEFADKDSVATAMALDDSLFRGRQIKVSPKRTNRPGISSTNRFPRSRGRGRGRGFNPRGRRPYGRYRRAAYYSPY